MAIPDLSSNERQEEVDPLDVYTVLLRTLEQVHPAFSGLSATHRRRGSLLFKLHTSMPDALPGLEQAARWLATVGAHFNHRAVTTLAERAADDVRRGIESSVALEEAALNDLSRDLMEIEALLHDFGRDWRQADRWLHASAKDRSDAFKYGKLLDRLRAAARLPQGMTLPSFAEYAIHSQGLHPTPDGRPLWSDLGDVTRLSLMLGDFYEHTVRNIHALLALLEAHGSEYFGSCREGTSCAHPEGWEHLDVFGRARDEFRRKSRARADHAHDLGLNIPDRSPYNRRTYADGIPTGRHAPEN